MKNLIFLMTAILSLSSFEDGTFISCKAVDSDVTVKISDAIDDFGMKVIRAEINHQDIKDVLETPKYAETINREAAIYALNFNTKLEGKRLMVEFLYDRDGLMGPGRQGKSLQIDYYYLNDDAPTILMLNCDEKFELSF